MPRKQKKPTRIYNVFWDPHSWSFGKISSSILRADGYVRETKGGSAEILVKDGEFWWLGTDGKPVGDPRPLGVWCRNKEQKDLNANLWTTDKRLAEGAAMALHIGYAMGAEEALAWSRDRIDPKIG